MPASDEFQVFRGWDPNQVVVRGHEQHVQVTSRDGYVHDFMIADATELAKLTAGFEKELKNLYVRLRRVWADNSNGNVQAYVQIVGDQKTLDAFRASEREFKYPFTTGNGQSLDVTITHVRANTSSDHFEANSNKFYDSSNFV